MSSPNTQITMPIPPAVFAYCKSAGLGDISGSEELKGGAISITRRLQTTSSVTLVLKQSTIAPLDLYTREMEGLQTLAVANGPRVPTVHAVSEAFLLLEDVGTTTPADRYWEQFGHAIAIQHQQTSSQFGFHHDNYLGLLPQRNPWTENGHDFFVQQRILRYLTVPLCEQTLTIEDRRNLERLAARFPQLVPVQPAALLHGDLWYGNMLVSQEGEPVIVDPAVYYGWPEAELSMIRQQGRVPEIFFAAYQELHPLEPGWWDRLELLYLREILSMIAHFGNQYNSLDKLRAVVATFL